MSQPEKLSVRQAFKRAQDKEVLFRRAERFHKELMEDFRFMEAARIHSGEYEPANLNTGHLQPQSKLRELMITNPYGLVNFAAYTLQQKNENSVPGSVHTDKRSLRFDTRMSEYPPLNIFAHWLLNTKAFEALMVFVIVVNSILIAVELELGENAKTAKIVLEALDFLFLMLFAVEILLKWMDDFRAFWDEGWNVFDFIVTSISFVPPLLNVIFDEEEFNNKEEQYEELFMVLKYLRILRIFRSLNVVTRIHKIRLIWEAVMKTFRELFFITLLMTIFFYIFAIVGIKLFEQYTLSHKTPLTYRDCFKDLPNAFATLFQIFTLDHYADILNEIQDGIQSSYLIYIYMLLWIFLGAFIFMNIFTGVMVNNFQNIRVTLLEAESEIEERKNLAIDMNVFGEDKKDEKLVDPHLAWEDEVFQNMQLIDALRDNLSPTIWPRDTLFQYYVLLEALASNVEEKNYIIRCLDNSLLRNFDQ